ncbi:VanZ family protein [Bacillus sp. FJAT-42315]|uniref:VanZ family protein n=1 Tax=Bacillus sp. FJAT-42315 TaxID=2014077 RepID=UPI000C233CA5|nr:VanZ family protein [Bacillus sp. FJAT-42315]
MRIIARGLSTIAPFVYIVAIWILSSLPHDAILSLPQNQIDLLFKESLHLIEFAVLYGLIVNALLANGRFSSATNLAAALIACFYGFIDEIHQAFIPYRSASIIDAIKDVTGVFICYLLVNYKYFQRPSSRIHQWMHKFSHWVSS